MSDGLSCFFCSLISPKIKERDVHWPLNVLNSVLWTSVPRKSEHRRRTTGPPRPLPSVLLQTPRRCLGRCPEVYAQNSGSWGCAGHSSGLLERALARGASVAPHGAYLGGGGDGAMAPLRPEFCGVCSTCLTLVPSGHASPGLVSRTCDDARGTRGFRDSRESLVGPSSLVQISRHRTTSCLLTGLGSRLTILLSLDFSLDSMHRLDVRSASSSFRNLSEHLTYAASELIKSLRNYSILRSLYLALNTRNSRIICIFAHLP